MNCETLSLSAVEDRFPRRRRRRFDDDPRWRPASEEEISRSRGGENLSFECRIKMADVDFRWRKREAHARLQNFDFQYLGIAPDELLE